MPAVGSSSSIISGSSASVVENLSDTITVLSRGEVLAEGDYQSVSRNPDVVQAYLGTAHV